MLRALLLPTFLMAAAWPSGAVALAEPSLQNTPLADILTRWAEQRSVTLVVPADLVEGLYVAGGESSERKSLETLLAPFGLEPTRTAQGAIIIRKAVQKTEKLAPGQPPARLTLPPKPAAPESDIILGTVLVTTQSRLQTFAEVPVAVTALTGNRVKRENLTDLERISERVPGFFAQRQTDASPSFVIRGIEASPVGTLGEPAVSITLDGFEANRQHGSNTELLDIDRIEVVRGPQGVLFGRGAQIGAIAIHTRRPDLSAASGSLELVAGNDALMSLSAIANLPKADGTGAARIALRRREQEGLRQNAFTPGQHVNDDDLQAARLSVAWAPADALRFDVIFDYQYDRDRAVSTKAVGLVSPGGDLDPNADAAQNPETLPPRRRIQRSQAMVNWDISPAFTLSGMTGLRETRLQNSFDPDGTSYPFLFSEAVVSQTAYQHEAALSYDGGGRWQATLGSSIFFDDSLDHNRLTVNEQLLAAGFPQELEPVGFVLEDGEWSRLSEGVTSDMFVGAQRQGYSVYSNIGVKLTERLTIDTGLRLSFDNAEVTTRASVYSIDNISPVLLPHGILGSTYGETAVLKHKETLFSPRIAVTYRVANDLNFYAALSEGSRGGFPQARIINSGEGEYTVTNALVSRETAINLETGLKGNLSDALKVDIAAFWYRLTDFQTLQPPPALTLTNGGRATGQGIELSASHEPVEGLDLYASYAWLHTQYDAFRTAGPDGVVHDLKGNRFRLAPEHTFNAAVDWNFPLTDQLTAFTSVNYAWRSRYFFNNDNLPNERQKAFGLLDVRAGITAPDGRWRAEIFGNNILDQDWIRDIGNTGKYFGISTAIPADPRTIGARLSFEFG